MADTQHTDPSPERIEAAAEVIAAHRSRKYGAVWTVDRLLAGKVIIALDAVDPAPAAAFIIMGGRGEPVGRIELIDEALDAVAVHFREASIGATVRIDPTGNAVVGFNLFFEPAVDPARTPPDDAVEPESWEKPPDDEDLVNNLRAARANNDALIRAAEAADAERDVALDTLAALQSENASPMAIEGWILTQIDQLKHGPVAEHPYTLGSLDVLKTMRDKFFNERAD